VCGSCAAAGRRPRRRAVVDQRSRSSAACRRRRRDARPLRPASRPRDAWDVVEWPCVVSTRRTPRLRQGHEHLVLVGGVDQHGITRTLASHHVRIVLVGRQRLCRRARRWRRSARASQRVGRRAGTGGRDHLHATKNRWFRHRVVSWSHDRGGRSDRANAPVQRVATSTTSR